MTSRRTPATSASAAPPEDGDEGVAKAPPARGRRSRERWTQRRAEVVDRAASVFAERGYHATSIEDLVAATGLQRGGLYHYIGSKEELLFQIHERFITPLLDEAKLIGSDDAPADVTLRRLGVALMKDIATYHDQVTVFLHEWRVIQHAPEWENVRKARREFEHVIERVLRRGVKEKIFKVDDIRLTALAFLGMFNYSYQWFRTGGRMDPEVVAETFCNIFLDGIRA